METDNKQKNNVIGKATSFARQHPILFNFMMVVLVGFGIVWMSLIALDIWTDHGKFEVVPSLRGLTYQQAETALLSANLKAELTDSIYDTMMPPGTVVEQSPRPNTKVKTNRTVYLTVTAFTPKMISMPSVTDMSERQARSTLEGVGITNIRVEEVASDYKDLVLGVRYNGLPIQAGARVPTTAVITIEVGMGAYDESSDSDSIAVEEENIDDFSTGSIFD
ncbi:MAG: PASTA domain-containing protein [Muribaculaceae bacterium]|nr:PASTA domain-containing protein [Muribaculaceae bacterium]